MKKRFFYVAILSLLSLVSFGQGGFTPIPKLKITTTPETNNSTTEVLVRDATTGNVGKVAKSSLGGTLDSVTDAGANTTNAISTGGVGINTTTPQALFDVVSTSSGILIPRLTTSQRDAIVSPSTSELIYNSTNGRFEFYNGIDWTFIGGSTSTPTLQEVTDEGATTTNTIEIDIDEGDAIILKSGGNNVGLISTTNGGVDFITNDVLGENATQYRNGNIEVNKNSGSPKTYQLPTNEDGTFDLVAIIVNANKTAENDGNYSVVANATFTDPTPAEGKGYMVTVINGTATIGGVGYTVGQKVFRHYHSGSWRTFVYNDDLENGCIPLSGTTAGNPVTGDIEIVDSSNYKIYSTNGDVEKGIYFSDDGFLSMRRNDTDSQNYSLVEAGSTVSISAGNVTSGYYSLIQVGEDGIGIVSNSPTSKGISSFQDFSANLSDLDYTQKIYVDNQRGKLISLTETQILAISSPEVGRLYYNTTQNHVVFYDGTGWKKLTHTNM